MTFEEVVRIILTMFPGPRCAINMNLDIPIYRIHSYRYLGDLLSGKLVLRSTSCWTDRYENLIAMCGYSAEAEDAEIKQYFFDQTRLPTFAQCWTTIQESDALWRIYSHLTKKGIAGSTFSKDEGVRLRTTPRKLVKCLAGSFSDKSKENCYIGPVHYLDAQQLKQYIADIIGTNREHAFSGFSGHVDALMLKRNAFEHEQEIRLLYIDTGREFKGEDQVEVPIDVNTVIEEITLDPRIPEGDKRIRREKWLRSKDFKNEISISMLYLGILLDVQLHPPEELTS